MGVARGDPSSREHKATHNSSTIEDKNPGNKKGNKNGGGWVHARNLHTSCAGRWHGREEEEEEKIFPYCTSQINSKKLISTIYSASAYYLVVPLSLFKLKDNKKEKVLAMTQTLHRRVVSCCQVSY